MDKELQSIWKKHLQDEGKFNIAHVDDSTAGTWYIGFNQYSTGSKSRPVTAIMKIEEAISGQYDVTWADGNKDFDNIWNDRASLDYSQLK